MGKLTLSVEDSVVSRAKQYAKSRGVSISEMVQTYLIAVSEPSTSAGDPPVLRSVRGILKDADREAYRQHLSSKYR